MNKQLKQFIDICEVYNAFQTKNQQFKSWVSYFLVEHYLVLVDGLKDMSSPCPRGRTPGKPAAGEYVGESFSTCDKSQRRRQLG